MRCPPPEESIPDLSYAKNILQQISYYSLIDGYKELFKPLRSGKYQHGVTFDEIVAFYSFDEELRSLFLKYILKVEQHMKSMVSYHFSEKYGEKLYNFHIRETIPDMPLHNKMQLPLKKGQYRIGKQDLFAVVIALRYLIENDDFKHFKSTLTRLIKNVLKKCPHLPEDQLLKEMGFPKNWNKITRYKK